MVTSYETPIAHGGYRYDHEVDGPDFAGFTAAELAKAAIDRDLDLDSHPRLAAAGGLGHLAELARYAAVSDYDEAHEALNQALPELRLAWGLAALVEREWESRNPDWEPGWEAEDLLAPHPSGADAIRDWRRGVINTLAEYADR